MKKRFLSTIMALILVLSLLPMSALAAEGPGEGPKQTGPAAPTGSENAAGLPAPGEDGVITLTNSITLSAPLVIDEDTTIDLNGQTLTLPVLEKNQAGITVSNGAELVIQDSKTGGKLVDALAEDDKEQAPTNTDLIVVESGALEITGGTIGENRSNGHGATQIVKLKSDSAFKLSGGALAGYVAGLSIASGCKNVDVEISGGSVEGQHNGIFVEANVTGVNLKITGGEISGLGQVSGAGIQNNGAGTFVISGDTTTISGGKVAVQNKGNCTFTIHGGSFGKAGNGSSEYVSVSSTAGTFQIFGGSFATAPAEALIPAGLEAEKQQDGTFKIVTDANNPAAQIGDDTYGTLTQALQAAENMEGDVTITLLRNAESTPVVVPDDVTVDTGDGKYVYYGAIKLTDAAGAVEYYNTLPEAVSAAANREAAVLICAPNSYILFQANNADLHGSLTIEGNGATVTYSASKVPDGKDNFNRIAIENSVTFTDDVTLTIKNLNNISVWGYRKTEHTFTLNMTNCSLVGEDDNATSRVYISTSGGNGQNKYHLNQCTFSHPVASIFSDAAGEVNVTDCQILGGVTGINISNKSTSGDLSVVIDGCTFTDIMQSEDKEYYAAPIRIVSEAAGTTTATIKDCTFVLTDESNASKQPNGDILLYDAGKPGFVNVQITNTEAAVTSDASGKQEITKDQNKVFVINSGEDDTITLPALEDGWFWFDQNNTRYEGGTNAPASSSYTARQDSGTSSSGSGVTRYAVSVPSDVEGGTVKASPARASRGSTVTITVTPDEGYELDALTVTDSDGKAVAVTDKGDGKYTFTMPRGKVEIDASFKPAEEEPSGLPFTDVAEGAWYYGAVEYAYENGLMTGTSATTFAPNVTTTRAMLATLLYRLEGSPDLSNEILGYPYADVDADSWYGDAVYWARLNGVVTGISAETFDPNGAITREQMAVMLYRYADYKGYDVTQGGMAAQEYADYESISSWAVSAVDWAVNAGLISGTSATTLTPQGSATRAEIATILMRFVETFVPAE